MERLSYYRAVGFFSDWNIGRILKVLASNGIGIFAISTYNTDYILTKEENFEKSLKVLKDAGYEIK